MMVTGCCGALSLAPDIRYVQHAAAEINKWNFIFAELQHVAAEIEARYIGISSKMKNRFVVTLDFWNDNLEFSNKNTVFTNKFETTNREAMV